MAKKLKEVWVVVPLNSIIVFKNFKGAEQSAISECAVDRMDYQILKVTETWNVSVPEEPMPEVIKDELEDIL